ncbi:MAG: alpha/beta hydrolase, partial [Candidatus Sericytochromatia bacterium]
MRPRPFHAMLLAMAGEMSEEKEPDTQVRLPARRPALARAWHAPFGKDRAEAIACACEAVRARAPGVTGTVWLHRNVPAEHLGNCRDVWVYLPPGYDATGQARYPVLYMHDGDNLFSAATAFLGREWGIDETAEWLIGAGLLAPLIVVGVGSTSHRLAEYTWVPDAGGAGGDGRAYGIFLVEELMPMIGAIYRTEGNRARTGTMGASLGGLFSLYAGARLGDAFGLVCALSPSLWWGGGRAFEDL